jgi:hypothetical protein
MTSLPFRRTVPLLLHYVSLRFSLRSLAVRRPTTCGMQSFRKAGHQSGKEPGSADTERGCLTEALWRYYLPTALDFPGDYVVVGDAPAEHLYTGDVPCVMPSLRILRS